MVVILEKDKITTTFTMRKFRKLLYLQNQGKIIDVGINKLGDIYVVTKI